MKKYWLLSFFVVVMVTIMGCRSIQTEPSKNLVVVEQTDTIRGGNEENEHEWVAFNVDIPVNGPQMLMDSLLVFVNKHLYEACESNVHPDEDIVAFNKEDMFTDDGERLFGYYMEKYKPLIQDSLWRTFGMTMKMEAQAETFVTYGLEFFYCGAGCSSDKYYYTFDKSDGHQIKEIISHDNLVRFFKDYPEYAVNEDYSWEFNPNNDYINSCYGLLEDCFSLVILGAYNHYFSVKIPLNRISSYLSPEVQTLLEQNEGGEALVTERQDCVLTTIRHLMTGEPIDIGISVDVPTAGNQVLKDSVMAFLNEELYRFFDSGEEKHLPYDSVFTNDSQLLTHYREAYQGFIERDSDFFDSHYLKLTLVAQTDTYVTYEADWSFHGEGIETYQDWQTFSKSDGRSFDKVVSDEDLLRFLEEHPDQRSNDMWEDIQFKRKEGTLLVDNIGLLRDSVAHQHCYANGIYETVKYDLKSILPYLSEETKKLVEDLRAQKKDLR